jgi:hypothetical protein
MTILPRGELTLVRSAGSQRLGAKGLLQSAFIRQNADRSCKRIDAFLLKGHAPYRT